MLESNHLADIEYLSATTLTGSVNPRESEPRRTREKFAGRKYEAIPGAVGILLSNTARTERLAR
jgi:hypothetical protein